jgi:hypothetical protein
MTDICYPPGADWSCAYTPEEIAALDPVVKERAEALAWNTLQALIGFRLSLCPVALRPCLAGCNRHTWDAAPVTTGGTFQPYNYGGQWYNGCGCTGDCSCTMLCEVVMPSPVGGIESVMLDGAVLAPSAYRVDNGNRLLRTDGSCWPTCQDMTKPGEAQYESIVTVDQPAESLRWTRNGNLVTVEGVFDQVAGGNFDSTIPYKPRYSVNTTIAGTAGGGSFNLAAGQYTLSGGGPAGMLPFTLTFETSEPEGPTDAQGSFIVSYYPNLAPNDLLRYAAGMLAIEYYKACSGAQCRLPSGVTNVSRAGLTMDIPSGLFPGGATGLREVDPIIRIYNPSGLKSPPRVMSPDSARGRVQTWGAA